MLRQILVLAAVFLLAGCPEPETTRAALQVENLRLIRERNGTQIVSGVVRNSSDRMRSAQLEITLYGPENERIGEVQVPVERIEADAIKGFNWSLDVDVVGVRLRRIMSF